MISRPAKLRRRLVAAAAVLAAATLVPSVPASAFIVYDPWNYSQNLLSAARALEQIRNQVTSLQNEAQMLINQAKNLASLPHSVLGQIDGDFSQMKDLLGQAKTLAYDVQDIDRQFKATYTQFGSNQTETQLVNGAEERWQQSVSAFEGSLKAGATAVGNIGDTQAETGNLVGASQAAVGVLEATQAGNQLIAVQTRQLTDLTAMLAAQGRADALEQARQAASEAQAKEEFRRFMQGSSYSPSTVTMFHN